MTFPPSWAAKSWKVKRLHKVTLKSSYKGGKHTTLSLLSRPCNGAFSSTCFPCMSGHLMSQHGMIQSQQFQLTVRPTVVAVCRQYSHIGKHWQKSCLDCCLFQRKSSMAETASVCSEGSSPHTRCRHRINFATTTSWSACYWKWWVWSSKYHDITEKQHEQ